MTKHGACTRTQENFRRQLEETTGFKIVDCEKDGNCLFRSVAHQIYGDPSRHTEVRQKCYDYMVARAWDTRTPRLR